MGGDAYINTIKNLGGDPTNPFQIFPEVKELYAKRAEELKKIEEDILTSSEKIKQIEISIFEKIGK